MREENKVFYKSAGSGIYNVFSTFAKGRTIAKCNAIEFCKNFHDKEGKITVHEYGVGDGTFAKIFLDYVKKLDLELYKRLEYYLFDFSSKMLKDCQMTLKSHISKCYFNEFDVLSKKQIDSFDYCRINELLSDLPSEFYYSKNGEIFDLANKKIKTPNIFVEKFLERIEEERVIPFNFEALNFILSLSKAANKNFKIDIFDYGFYFANEIYQIPKEIWNKIIIRKYKNQITTDLNFFFLFTNLSLNGLNCTIEKQKDYAERILGEKLDLIIGKDFLDYKKSKSKKFSYNVDDGFYYLGIRSLGI
jgi:SAM-dependent MidA family methyltransferase